MGDGIEAPSCHRWKSGGRRWAWMVWAGFGLFLWLGWGQTEATAQELVVEEGRSTRRLAKMLPPGSASRDRPSWAVENALWRRLADWSEGGEASVQSLADMQQRVLNAMAGFEVRADTLHRLETPEGAVPGSEWILPGRGCLDKAHYRLVDELVTDPEVFLPLAYLFLAVQRAEQGVEQRFWLADFNLHQSRLWIRRYLSERAKTDTGDLQSPEDPFFYFALAMADQLRQGRRYRSHQRALRIFEAILRDDPSNSLALYWAAFLSEKYAVPTEAARYGQRLLDLYPDDVEVRLRLAVNLLRIGRREKGEALLFEVAEGSTPPWMGLVAFEQLAQLHAERPAQAQEILQQGLDRFPAAASLNVLMAYHKGHAWQDAGPHLRKANRSWQGAPALAPRARYDLAREAGFETVWRRLEQAVEARLPALRDALTAQALRWRTGSRPQIAQCEGALAEGALR